MLRPINTRPKYSKVLQSFVCLLRLGYVDNPVKALTFRSSLFCCTTWPHFRSCAIETDCVPVLVIIYLALHVLFVNFFL